MFGKEGMRSRMQTSKGKPREAREPVRRNRPWPGVFGRLLCQWLAFVLLAGCEEKVIQYHPFLAGLPNAETQAVTTGPKGEYIDPTIVPGNKIEQKKADGSTTLVAKTGQHLMVHIFNCVQRDDARTFVDQVLSDMTKQEYYARGQSPERAFETIKDRKSDMVRLFRAMPSGEGTPGLLSDGVGQGVRRFVVTGKAAQGLSWIGIDMVMEKGNWKLRWFVQP